MSYTEKKERNGSAYYYRVRSYRENGKVKKRRRYMGKDLGDEEVRKREEEEDRELNVLESLLSGEDLKTLERIRREHEKAPVSTVENRYEAFVSRFTHDSNAIEGNTLTLQETAGVLFDRITPPSKSLREINETLNHKEAFDLILSFEGRISRDLVFALHRTVVKDTLPDDLVDQVGKYRTVQVHIRGVEWMPPAPEYVPHDMKQLFSWYTRNEDSLHPVVLASYFHVGFETIHPFIDGNGRVGRLLLNFILHRKGFPMVNIPNRRKLDYYNALDSAQVDGDLGPFVGFMIELMKESYY